MDYRDYIKTELLILIPVMYLIGVALKKSKIANKWIPMCIGVCSVLLSAFWVFASSDIADAKKVLYAIFISITQGVLIAGASVYVNQLIVQGKKEE